MKDFSARFVEVVESLGQNGYKLDGVGCITKQKVSNIRKGITDVKTEVVAELCNAFPKVNANYILTGKGSMFLDEEPVSLMDEPVMGAIPYYKELPVSAGKHELLRQYIENEGSHGWIKLPDVTAIAAFPVKGCSMKPDINDGDFIAIARVERWESVEPDKIYMIVTNDDRMIKHLVKDEEEDSFLWAMSPNYPRFKVFKHDIIEIYRVVFSGRMV